jgi:hypothetical protein
MFKWTTTYVDFNGIERTEDFYFNLTKKEAIDSATKLLPPNATKGVTSEDTFKTLVQSLYQNPTAEEILHVFEVIIDMSYGVKSEDGRRFIKTPQVLEEFKQTEAYSELFMELTTDVTKSIDFVNAITPDITPHGEEQKLPKAPLAIPQKENGPAVDLN